MDTPIAPAAPAPSAEPVAAPTQTAVEAAVVSGDFGSFKEAGRAERVNKPLPDVPLEVPSDPPTAKAATPAPVAPAPERTLSKRQQDINDRIREAVERATADKDAEIARLRTSQPAAPV